MAKEFGILFADISGTTRLFRKIGTDEAKHQLDRCVKRMERAIESTKGELVMPAVDEMIARFDTADDAVLAAAEMQRRLQDLPPLSGVRLSIRIGVHFGAAEQGPGGLAGPAVKVGRALLNLAGAGQIVTCEKTAKVLSRAQQENLYSAENLSMPLSDGSAIQVYFYGWQGVPERSEASGESVGDRTLDLRVPVRLALRWGSRAFLIDASTPSIKIGRDRECELRLSGVKVSRTHARIEMRTKGFFLIDESSNGTYLYVDGVGENRILDEEVVMQGRGRIAFGHTTDKDDGEIVHFELS
jgi:hypothetical protein